MTDDKALITSMNDHVDEIAEQWQRERPDLDPSPMLPIGRIYRLHQHLRTAIETVHQQFGLATGEFDVLATLLRNGAPYCMTPTALFRSAMLTSGAMTNRLNRLEKAGWIERIHDQNDRRSLLVQLSEDGKALIDRMIVEHLRIETELLNNLTQDNQTQLNNLLKKWLSAFE